MTRAEESPGAAGAPLPGPAVRAGDADGRFPWHAPQPTAPATPSGRASASGRPAGFVSRALANAVDVVVVGLALTVGYAAVAGLRFLWAPTSFRLVAPDLPGVVVTAGVGLVLYWTVSWTRTGRTSGDQVMALRVVGPHGARLHLLHAAVRAVACVLFLPGLFWVLVSRRNRSVQDVLLRTAVVYD
ncbi:RDD family protein [Blastococcus sp. SYSU D00695]